VAGKGEAVKEGTTSEQTKHRPSIIDLLTGSNTQPGTHTPLHRGIPRLSLSFLEISFHRHTLISS
jgi:hypothetical protein